MKKSVSVLSLILAILVAVSGCAANGEIKFKELFDDDGIKIISSFGEEYLYKTILDDLKNLDMNHEPNYSGLSHTSALNIDDDTVVHQYFDGEKLVYQVYENYGEEGFTYYTKSVSGKELEVSYYTEGEKIISVTAKSDNYSVSFENLNAKMPCGAENVYVTATKKGSKDIPETISYEIKNKSVFISKAYFFEDGEYKSYTSDADEKRLQSSEKGIKFEKFKLDTDIYTTNIIMSAKNPVAVHTLLGRHIFRYKDTDKGMKWFMQCNVYVVFENENEAKKFISDNNLSGDSRVSTGSDYSLDKQAYVEFKDMNFAITDGFELDGKNINEYVFEETNDNTFADISFNADGEITKLEYNNSVLSCG